MYEISGCCGIWMSPPPKRLLIARKERNTRSFFVGFAVCECSQGEERSICRVRWDLEECGWGIPKAEHPWELRKHLPSTRQGNDGTGCEENE